MTPRTRIILVASAAALALVALFVTVGQFPNLTPDASHPSTAGDEHPVHDLPMLAWPTGTEDAPIIALRVDPNLGPLWERGQAAPIQLTPAHPDLALNKWRVVSDATHTQVIGEGTWKDASVVARWTFAAQNPQAYFSLKVTAFPLNHLREHMSLKLPLPKGHLSLQAPAEGMHAQAATWWAESDPVKMTVSNWSGDALQAAGQVTTSAEAQDLLLSLWPGSAHLQAEACAQSLTIDLQIDFLLSFGAATPVAIWPYADGADAAVAPIFGLPAEHSDPQLAEASAPDARRWLLRAHTLIYGHSDPNDPRFGNGGLLGYGLGATFLIPDPFRADPGVIALAEKLRGTRVELTPLLSESAKPDTYPGSSRAAKSITCEQLAALAEREVPALIITQSAPDEASKRPIHQGPAGWPLVVLPETFDGRLQSLRLKGFQPSAAAGLLKEHRTRVFSSPFVATRNPLIGAAHESLLQPERDGHWTVSPSLSGVMSNLEFWREESPIMVSSVTQLAQHRQSIQQIKAWWTDTKTLEVFNPTDKTIRGFTLALRGEREAQLFVEGQADQGAQGMGGEQAQRLLNRRVLSAPRGAPAQHPTTLVWWDLAPGTQRVVLHNPDPSRAQALSLEAVSWDISTP